MQIWIPNYSEFQEVFSNDNCLKILVILSQKQQTDEPLCATDVAKILDVHVSTATKYLDLLCKHDFVNRNQILNRPGKPTYYTTKSDSISIRLDLPHLNQSLQTIFDTDTFPNPVIREKFDVQERVDFVLDDDGIVTQFIVKRKTKARRIVKQKINLSRNESQFMKYLPHPTKESKPFLDICKNANLSGFITIKGIVSFVEKLRKYEIIDIKDSNLNKSPM